MKNEQNQSVYYGKINHKGWPIFIAATDKGLCFVGSLNDGIDELKNWVDKNRSNAMLVENKENISPYVYQLEEYFDGKRKSFDVPLDLKGTLFQESVWKALQNIPYGETVSYADVADKIGNPKAVRAVGAANGANPVMIVVPCHRVVAKSGQLTGFRGGLEMKKALLALEKSNKMGD
ncbi:cysteine methyltransferase [Pueribacillus theae]|uniref:Methylated-DNA--protein-cysteine methyltransferase n=1 Tax=Pueribacillus theae TaxID=2171751 RepID=A0A2U1K7B9_9BACI|nr:methylated-DNA--[protein]-cysteine S-methyltransferase [Pueribacillus theae]PWA13155.1 cysteine methyltransferase [Pueribacillus theae]